MTLKNEAYTKDQEIVGFFPLHWLPPFIAVTFLDSWPRSRQRREKKPEQGEQGTWFPRKPQVIIRPSEDLSSFVLMKAGCCHLRSQQMLEQAPQWAQREKTMGLEMVGVAASFPCPRLAPCHAASPSSQRHTPHSKSPLGSGEPSLGVRTTQEIVFPGVLWDRMSLLRACLGLYLSGFQSEDLAGL